MDNTKQIVGRYTEAQQAMIRKFVNDEQFYSFVFKDLTEGVTRLGDNPLDTNGWMHDLVVEHLAVPRQQGQAPNREEFAYRAEVVADALRIVREVLKAYEVVANFDDKPEKEKKEKPTLK